MDKERFIEILKGVCKLYDKEMDKETMMMWLSFFKEENIENFKQAINKHIKTSKYFPTIADIKSNIYDLTHEEESNMDLWEKLLIAIGNGNYHAEEEFKKLPEVVQKYLGSPQRLQSFAVMNSDDIHTVVKGQFLKQIEYVKASCKENEITKWLYLENKEKKMIG